jgi:hypothetical protein
VVLAQQVSIPNAEGYNELFTVWGQFVDHDVDLTPDTSGESAEIEVPTGDLWFDPFSNGGVSLPFQRSGYVEGTGTNDGNPREHPNTITSFIDASTVYGSDPERADFLRTEGGKLKVSNGDLLPLNDPNDPMPNAGPNGATSFLAGDVRANENVALTAVHTAFVREHNAWVDRLSAENPGASDEWLYQKAKAYVEAEIQHITYNEYLPLLLGPDALSPYSGYNPNVDPSILTEFSTAAFRFGHSMVAPMIHRLEEDGGAVSGGHLDLKDSFFAPDRLMDEGGIESIIRGVAEDNTQELDAQVIDGLRSFLFGPPGAGGLDLASLNIQRGRDHGLPTYNEYRAFFGKEPAADFSDITSDSLLQAKLEAVYGSVDKVDLWVGGIAEDHVDDAIVGPTFQAILVEQFTRLRDGDQFWYENDRFTEAELEMIRSTSLSDILERATGVNNLQDDLFFAYDRQGGGDGDDMLVGGAERDLLLGFGGDDILAGSAGDDQLIGDSGSDRLYGGAGRDKLEGGDGDDRLFGNDGDDILLAGDGNDHLSGQAGDDVVSSGGGDDNVEGGSGDDIICGGLGNDTLRGGVGADTFVFRQGDADIFAFNNPVDIIEDWDSHDIIKLYGTVEFTPVKIQWSAYTGNSLPDDVMMLLSNGQRIFIKDAVLDSETPINTANGAPNFEFVAGCAGFGRPLTTGANADDFILTTEPDADWRLLEESDLTPML